MGRPAKGKGEGKGRSVKRQRQVRGRTKPNQRQEQKMETDFEEPEGTTEETPKQEAAEERMLEKPKKPKKPPKEPRKAKGVRMRVVWGVFSSSVQCVQTFPYAQKREAEALAAKLTTEKKALYFVQPIRELIPEETPTEGA